MTQRLDPSNQRLLPAPLPLESAVPTVPMPGAIFKDVAFGEKGVEAVCTEYMNEPLGGLYINFRDFGLESVRFTPLVAAQGKPLM